MVNFEQANCYVQPPVYIDWVWQWRTTGNGAAGVWTYYRGSASDAKDGPTTQHTCYQRRVSTLTRQLTLNDTNREYRCYVRCRRAQGPFTAFVDLAATYVVGTVSGEDV